VAVIDLGSIAIESGRLLAIAQLQLLRFLHWDTAADDDLSGGIKYFPTVTDLIARTMSQVQTMEALKILGNSPNVSTDVFCFDVNKFGHILTIPRDEACSGCND